VAPTDRLSRTGTGTGQGAAPTLRVERSLLREGYRLIASMDEVGRGALAGPASVGIVLVDDSVRTAPSGVRDSKLLTPAARKALVPRIRRWAPAYAVGHASPQEVDAVGILGALRLAARRALALLPAVPDLVLLDGNHDWFTEPAARRADGPAGDPTSGLEGLFTLEEVALRPVTPSGPVIPVRTMIKADLRCSSVAAASVLAKVERDDRMVRLHDDYPAYCWADNKGYSAPEHMQALLELGPCEQHRRSWRLPCASEPLVGENGGVGVPEQAGGPGPEQQISIMEVMTR
jgi:ribonuclease HII